MEHKSILIKNGLLFNGSKAEAKVQNLLIKWKDCKAFSNRNSNRLLCKSDRCSGEMGNAGFY